MKASSSVWLTFPVSEGGRPRGPVIVPPGEEARSPQGLVRVTPLRSNEARRIRNIRLLVVVSVHVVLHNRSGERIARTAEYAAEVHLYVSTKKMTGDVTDSKSLAVLKWTRATKSARMYVCRCMGPHDAEVVSIAVVSRLLNEVAIHR